MGRTKNIIAAILPVFWLVALMYGPWAVSAFSPDYDCAACNATSQSENPGTATDACLRTEVRRANLSLPAAAQPNVPSALAATPISDRHFSPLKPLTGAAYLLQQRWQFVWRTADSPRAPSRLA